jgi:hypothetical protein
VYRGISYCIVSLQANDTSCRQYNVERSKFWNCLVTLVLFLRTSGWGCTSVVDRQNVRGQKAEIKYGSVERAMEKFSRHRQWRYSAFMISIWYPGFCLFFASFVYAPCLREGFYP